MNDDTHPFVQGPLTPVPKPEWTCTLVTPDTADVHETVIVMRNTDRPGTVRFYYADEWAFDHLLPFAEED